MDDSKPAPPDPSPPRSEDELMRRASGIAGRRLAELAGRFDEPVPPDLRRHKGWVGELVERCLGASAGNRSVPDFVGLGVELKTLPVDRFGKPLQTTYVCTVPLTEVEALTWAESGVLRKLARVLWVPVLAEADVPLAARMVGRAVLWSPSAAEEDALCQDWTSHIDTIRRGYVDAITAHDGQVLQIRPKAADASRRTWSIDPDGESILTLPRGFYLRTAFTEWILRQNFGVD